MIGAGMRVKGNIAFSGVLRVQGDVLGDVSCDVDPNGTIVADISGNVSGTIKVPHIVVKGRVAGPVHSSQSIQVQQGACVVGDVYYKEIEIHEGGVIEGALMPTGLMDSDRLGREQHIPAPEPINEYALPNTNGAKLAQRFGRGFKLGSVAILSVAVFVIVWVGQNPVAITPPADNLTLKADSSITEASQAKSAVAGSEGAQAGIPMASNGEAVHSLAAGKDAETGNVDQTLPSDRAEMHPGKVVIVQGVNPAKPAGFFWLITKEPSVLLKKKRQDPADGTRIEVSQGKKVSIEIAENEIFRVVEGRGIEILYQGRKVGPKTIESGAWISFVPQSPGRAK